MNEAPSIATLLQQGLFHHQRGEIAQAMERYTDVLRTDPQNKDALYYVAVVACQEGQFKQGIDLARRALAQGAKEARVHNLLGKALEREGEHLEAIKAFDAAIAADANFAEAHGNRASILAAAGLPDEALKGFDRAVALDPKAVADWINRGSLLLDLGRYEEALASYEKAIALAPDDPNLQVSRADTLSMLGRFAEGEAAYNVVIKRNPKFALPYAYKGLAVKHQGRLAEARALMEEARRLDPNDANNSYHLALITLLMGDWRAGFPLLESRVGLPKPSYETLDYPRWQGERPGDFRLVLLCEQGLGDSIQFSRYASLLAGRGHAVWVVAPPVLAPLLRTLTGIERVISTEEELNADKRSIRWLPLLSTMGLLHLTPDTVPAQAPYLSAEPERVRRWAERIGSAGFKVGIFWQGQMGGPVPAARAAPLAAFAPLAEIDGVRLISLQKGAGTEQATQVPFAARIECIMDPNDPTAEGPLDSAAVMANLDLVVSIDSMPAHLAGALSRPTFTALPMVPDWRWLMGRDDTPWYPTMRLFRQEKLRDWEGVFTRIADAVRDLSTSQA
ncbi:MAG TPA: tetratricopeptide repeat protein [Stellaceae bacterium]|nr:tetratricopeptide repeat protein [Stellaceae bacterium]